MLQRWFARGVVSALLSTCFIPVQAEEGLWTFDHFPVDRVKALYGAQIDQAWLSHVERSALRLSNGCSASLVSAAGLVLTDNHCVTECAQELSSAGNDTFTKGFVAEDKLKERRCTHLTAEEILSVTEVTQRVLHAGAGLSGVRQLEAQADVIRELEASACGGDLSVHCQVSKFYDGAQYKLFRYRRFDDLRLAFSPGTTMSTFGENDAMPRRLDVALLRVYDKNRPLVAPDYLRWSHLAPRSGDLVFVAGSPRISERELTASQLQTERDMALPVEIKQRNELNKQLAQFNKESAANRVIGEYPLSDSENHTEYLQLLEKALLNGGWVTRKLQEERRLQADGGPGMQAQFAAITQAEHARREQALARQFLVTGPFFDATSSQLFRDARILVRSALERTKPSAERLPGYTDAELQRKEQQLLSEGTMYPPFERLVLRFWLGEAQRSLPSEDAVLKLLLEGQKPDDVAKTLSQSQLGDAAVRERLWAGGLAAVQASQDPMIRYVLRIEPAAEAVEAKWQETVLESEARASSAIQTARIRMNPNEVYPDANLTLRLSYGKIAGFEDGGTHIGPLTTLSDLYRGEDAHPSTLDPRWTAAKGRLNLGTSLNLFTTNDGINGNSGSPLLNARGEIVGVFYGGNSYASAGDYGYDAKHNRALAVSAPAIRESLNKVYGAEILAAELEKVP